MNSPSSSSVFKKKLLFVILALAGFSIFNILRSLKVDKNLFPEKDTLKNGPNLRRTNLSLGIRNEHASTINLIPAALDAMLDGERYLETPIESIAKYESLPLHIQSTLINSPSFFNEDTYEFSTELTQQINNICTMTSTEKYIQNRPGIELTRKDGHLVPMSCDPDSSQSTKHYDQNCHQDSIKLRLFFEDPKREALKHTIQTNRAIAERQIEKWENAVLTKVAFLLDECSLNEVDKQLIKKEIFPFLKSMYSNFAIASHAKKTQHTQKGLVSTIKGNCGELAQVVLNELTVWEQNLHDTTPLSYYRVSLSDNLDNNENNAQDPSSISDHDFVLLIFGGSLIGDNQVINIEGEENITNYFRALGSDERIVICDPWNNLFTPFKNLNPSLAKFYEQGWKGVTIEKNSALNVENLSAPLKKFTCEQIAAIGQEMGLNRFENNGCGSTDMDDSDGLSSPCYQSF